MPDFEICALSTSRGRAEAGAFGVATFDNDAARPSWQSISSSSLSRCRRIRLVVAALDAGKMEFIANGRSATAWPRLRRSPPCASARPSQVVVGLQVQLARVRPCPRSDCRRRGVGRVVSTSLIGSGGVWGPATDDFMLIFDDQRQVGATLATISMGHTLEELPDLAVPGEFTSLSATAAIAWPEVVLVEADLPGGAPPMTRSLVAGRTAISSPRCITAAASTPAPISFGRSTAPTACCS